MVSESIVGVLINTLLYLERSAQVLQPCSQHVTEGVLVRDAEHHHRSSVLTVEIDALRHLSKERTHTHTKKGAQRRMPGGEKEAFEARQGM